MRLHYDRTGSPGGASIDSALGEAYHGLGQIIEYLAAEVKRISAPSSQIPVELSSMSAECEPLDTAICARSIQSLSQVCAPGNDSV